MAHDHGDSAGVPWEGRTFHDNPHAGDSGMTPSAVAERLDTWRNGTGSFTDLVAELAANRFLIPLVAHAGDAFDPDHPVMEDKVQELSVVTVSGPAGERVIPAFTSVAAMSTWNAEARPVPIEARRVALAAASEDTHRLVVNPGTDNVVIRRPALWAIAQGETYFAPWESVEFVDEVRAMLDGIDHLSEVGVAPGDPRATGDGADVALFLGLPDGLDAEDVRAVVSTVHSRVSQSDTFIHRVDGLTIALRKLPA